MAITDIEWSDYVWNPVRGCSMAKGSELGGCLSQERVVSIDKLTWTVRGVVFGKACAASTRAQYRRILLAWFFSIAAAMRGSVVRNRRFNLQVLWPVVGLVAVYVMNQLTLLEQPADLSFSYKAMFIYIAAYIGPWMLWQFEKHISVGGDGATAFPVWVAFPPISHISRLARYNQPYKDIL